MPTSELKLDAGCETTEERRQRADDRRTGNQGNRQSGCRLLRKQGIRSKNGGRRTEDGRRRADDRKEWNIEY